MDAKYLLIKQLIDKVADYEAAMPATSEMTLEGFSQFICQPSAESYLQKRQLAGHLEMEVQERGNRQETTIAILVTFIYRYAKLYAKKVLQHSPFSTLDDFSYTITLLTHESLSKKELIQKNVHEKTTGMEIIKRLLKQNLIHQFDNEDDKRSQRVAITEQGRGAIFSVLHRLEDVSTIMTGNLSEHEKNTLNTTLKKLDHFHYDIFMNDRDKSLTEIIQEKVER
ncbi:MAG: MarR family transcriptional regulator [Bacteroidia bacterium]|nr:MarR family transcriptional regulator [Bacteroidia bacterium]